VEWFTTKCHQPEFGQLVQEWSRCEEEGIDGLLQGLTGPLGPLATLVLWIHLQSTCGCSRTRWVTSLTWWVIIMD